jgi:hypothetical protein
MCKWSPEQRRSTFLISERLAAMAVGFLYGAVVHTVVNIGFGEIAVLQTTKYFGMIPEQAAIRNSKTHQDIVPSSQANDEHGTPKKFIPF